VIANYLVDPEILLPYLPYKTELDLWKGRSYLSLVGFMFLNTKIKGIMIPFHVNFAEVNLRFYVRYKDGDEWQRGVVFIKEIVPKLAIALVARTLYRENYQTLPMKHSWVTDGDSLITEYRWKKGRWNSIKVRTSKSPSSIESKSEEEFITEHYRGYTRVTDSKTREYQVDHPTWKVYQTQEYAIDVDFESSYGEKFDFLKDQNPTSVFLAEGSEVKIKEGKVV